MHPNNLHRDPYNFKVLTEKHLPLQPFVFVNEYDTSTIDFANPEAVFHLNKALLLKHYGIKEYTIPSKYLCPPVPGRADYIHFIHDLLSENTPEQKEIRGLDVGVGANCIYPILGAQLYGWDMVGADISKIAVSAAKANVEATPSLKEKVDIRYQSNNAHIFEGIIKNGEHYDFTMCNPPFHASEEEALKGTLRKLYNLKKEDGGFQTKEDITRNFGGHANELWVNGGEALFIKRMIKQSVTFKTQVGFFTTLVSKKENLNKFYKLITKLKGTHQTIKMAHGNKISHILIWHFDTV